MQMSNYYYIRDEITTFRYWSWVENHLRKNFAHSVKDYLTTYNLDIFAENVTVC